MNWDYVAGFFDGEGSIFPMYPGSNCFRVSISQSNEDILTDIAVFLISQGITSIQLGSKPEKTEGRRHSEMFHLRFSQRDHVILFATNVMYRCYLKRAKLEDAVAQLIGAENAQTEKDEEIKKFIRAGLTYWEVFKETGRKFGWEYFARLRKEVIYE